VVPINPMPVAFGCPWLARGVWLSLAYFAQQETGGLGHRVIDGGEPSVMQGGLDRLLKIVGQVDHHA
jgi:hypothetical protein